MAKFSEIEEVEIIAQTSARLALAKLVGRFGPVDVLFAVANHFEERGATKEGEERKQDWARADAAREIAKSCGVGRTFKKADP